MSLPKKGSRKISVGDSSYIWRVSNNGDNIAITIQKKDKGQILSCLLSPWSSWDHPITPSFVKFVIEKAIKEGWEPDEIQKPIFILKDDDDIWKKLGVE